MQPIRLILPALTGIPPWLTSLAAVGLAMIGAMIVHIRRKEYPNLILNVVLLALAVHVAYGRFFLVEGLVRDPLSCSSRPGRLRLFGIL